MLRNPDNGMTLVRVTRRGGIAGQFALVANVQYPGEPVSTVTFTSSAYGGPVVMSTAANPGGAFVTRPERFGSQLSGQWVARFFGATEEPYPGY